MRNRIHSPAGPARHPDRRGAASSGRTRRSLRTASVLAWSLLSALLAHDACAQGTMKAISESRTGAITIAIPGGGEVGSLDVPGPDAPFGPIDFDYSCTDFAGAEGCIEAYSAWLGPLPADFSCDGYESSGDFDLDPTTQLLVFGSITTSVTFAISGLDPGETMAFAFSGEIADSGGNSSVLLTGPGVSALHAQTSWNQTVHFVNGNYTLTISNSGVALGNPGWGYHYVLLDRIAPPPDCGDPRTGSCFETGIAPHCDDATCCIAVCTADPFCCSIGWDGLCVSGALSACLPEETLCAGRALRFGATDYAEVPSFGLSAPTQEITIEFWQRRDAGVEATLVACQSGLTNRIVAHTPWQDGQIIFDFGGAFTGGRITAPAPPGLSGTWHHFAFVASNPGQFMRIYHNGQLLAEKVGANGFVHADVPLRIAETFIGAVDELRIWSTARTAEQIASTWDRTVPADSDDLQVYYRMDSAAETAPRLLDRAAGGGLEIDHADVFNDPALIETSGCAVDLCDDSSIRFDGIDGHVDVGAMAGFGGSVGESTLEFWVKTTDTGSAASPVKIIDDRPGDGDPVYGIDFNRSIAGCVPGGVSPGRTLFFLRDNDLRVLAAEIDAPQLYSGRWTHVAWRIVDAGANQMEIYVDGALVAPVAICMQGPAAFAPWSDTLVIGASNNRGTIERHFDGLIDEVRLFDVARTPAEIQANWDREIHPGTAGLVGYWRFEEGSGFVAHDYAGANHGVLVGGAVWDESTPCDAQPGPLGDLDGNEIVDGADLGLLLGAWGPCRGCPADLNGDGVVDGADLGLLLGNWS